MTSNTSWSLYKQSRCRCSMHSMYFKAPIEKRICGAGSFFLPRCSACWVQQKLAKSRHLHHLNDGCPPIFDTYDKRCWYPMKDLRKIISLSYQLITRISSRREARRVFKGYIQNLLSYGLWIFEERTKQTQLQFVEFQPLYSLVDKTYHN